MKGRNMKPVVKGIRVHFCLLRASCIQGGFVNKLLLLPLLAMGLYASEHKGVVKYAGLPVPGASVTATMGEKKVSVVTDDTGLYDFTDLADGVWKLKIEMLCFEPIEQDIAVAANAPAAEWTLKLLPFDQIKASAPPPPPPSTTTSTAAPQPGTAAPAAPASEAGKPSIVVANGGAASSTAANGKNAKNSKGKPQPQAANTAGGFQRAQVSAAGEGARPPADSSPAPTEAQQAPSDGFLINGSVNNGANTPFAQSAAFGNNRRGIRSLYNGNVGLTNVDIAAWDAQQFNINGQSNLEKPSYQRLTGVAAFGGPVRIPHVWIRNTPNFFVNYQWSRNTNVQNAFGTVPTQDMRNGDLTALNPHLVDPTTGNPLPGNQIPANLISKQAISLLQLYPLPNSTNSRYNYQLPVTSGNHSDAMQVRMNKSIKRKDNVAGVFAFQSTRADQDTSIFNFEDKTRTLGMNVNFNWMHRVSQRMFLTTTLNYSRQASRLTPMFAFQKNISGQAGITGNNQDPAYWGPPTLGFSSGFSGLGDASYSFNRNQTAGINENLFWNHGSHNVTVVGEFRRQQFNQIAQQNPRGSFNFTGQAVGNDFAGFLLGIPDSTSIAFGNADKYFRAGAYALGFTDDWRVSPSLTLNAGMRWEYNTPVTEIYGRLVNLDVTQGFGNAKPVVAQSPTGPLTGRAYPDSLVDPNKHAFQPRVGLSWRPFMASSMVIRAGYGVAYDTQVYFGIAARMAQQSPLSKTLSIANSLANPLTLASGFNAPPNVLTNTWGVDPNFKLGYSQNWQVTMQRDLPGSLVMTAMYLGVKGTHAMQQILPNTYPVGGVSPCAGCPSGYYYLLSGGNSTRHAGSLMLRRRLHNGFTSTINYTYSKSIDNGAVGSQGQAGGNFTAQNWLDLHSERALSNFDQRHLVNITGQYTSGMGLKGGTLMGGWKGPLLKDWTFATNLTMGSGKPITPIYPSIIPGTGSSGALRPDVTGLSLYDGAPGLFLNPKAFAKPADGHYGNAARNLIIGPAQFSLNGSMARTFRMSDRLNADVRFDASNILNHVTYGSWVANISSLQFGLPTGPSQMRTMQATFRLRF
jgi:hypothetical protein